MGGQRTYSLRCADCGLPQPQTTISCTTCAGTLVTELESPSPTSSALLPPKGIWAHSRLLPLTNAEITLGEGNTPMLDLDGGSTFAKLESSNPTLSFKDRGMALATSVAIDRGMSGLIVASTGNAAVSASAYAAAAGISCTVLVGSASQAARKLAACEAYGATVMEVEGDYSTAYAAAAAASDTGLMNVSTTYVNPMITDAYRTLAAEIITDLGRVPSVVVVPIGAGPLLRGIWLGFLDLHGEGTITSLPRMIGVQAASCAPIVRAWETAESRGEHNREKWLSTLLTPFSPAQTSATAIADALRGYERQGLLTLDAIHQSGGAAVSVTEQEIMSATKSLLTKGLWVEPASATAHAARTHIQGDTNRGIALILTGHGIKSTTASASAPTAQSLR